MANALSPATLTSINAAMKNITGLDVEDVYTLATQGLITMDDDGNFELTKKAGRAVTRAKKAAAAEEIRPIVWEAISTISQDSEAMFRLDDVLKATGLNKGENRQNILEALRYFRVEGMVHAIKLSDNNFQIFWMRTAESLA